MTSKSLAVVLGMVAIGLIAVTMVACSPSSGDDPTGIEAQAVETLASESVSSSGSQVKKANVALDTCSADLLQTSDTAWTLAKTGVVDTANSTVTWTVTATKGATIGGHLVADGFLKVSNSGTGPATVGNVVVNLQTKVAGKWVTQSSDIADATQGDTATTAHVVAAASSEGRTLFTENAASGHLTFTVRTTNTVLSLVPEVSIPARTSVNLVFSATFDDNVLHLATRSAMRTEIIVTFGNHPAGGSNLTDTNVDINGNGIIDPDEAKVRSVGTRFQDTVPNTRAANSTIAITDALADITTTGTVTFSNPVFNLGPTGGTVKVTYDAGASGGSITNCAHANGHGITDAVGQFQFPIVPAFHADACDTQQISAHTCTPGTPGCGWKDGDLVTYGQVDWTTNPTALNLLLANFPSVYASTGGSLLVGLLTPSGFTILFTSGNAIAGYLPAQGTPGPLNTSYTDPAVTASGVFGGDVVGLRLNVDFADAHVLPSASGVIFGDLTLCGFSVPGLNGMTVRQFLATGETLLGGGPGPFSITDIQPIISQLASAFTGGTATTFAQQHLVNGPCPTCTPGTPGCGWKDGDLATNSQGGWSAGGTGATLVLASYDNVYVSTSGVFEVGNGSGGGFSLLFTSGNDLLALLPAGGTAASLSSNLLNTTSSPAGIFGGEVVCLKLNIDFSDQGLLSGTSGLKFGDLTLCGLTATPGLNGMTVRQVLAAANVALGGNGVPTTYTPADFELLGQNLNASFAASSVSIFAQQHLVNGPCP